MGSKIEWLARPGTTPEVWNPVSGCTKVSAGCKHCYAERQAERFWATQYQQIPLHPEMRDGAPQQQWRSRQFTDVQCHEDRLDLPLRWQKPRTVFVNSMSDLFHEAVSDAFIDRVFAVMALCPQHTFIVLTKRAERMREYLTQGFAQEDARRIVLERVRVLMDQPTWIDLPGGRSFPRVFEKWPLPNVWLGVSVEDQVAANARIPLLLQTPAAVRVVSAEPLLGPVDLTNVDNLFDSLHGFCERRDKVDWLIAGGESGPQARPCDVAWIRFLKDQAKAAGVPCFVKQLGANAMHRIVYGHVTFDPAQETHLEPMGLKHRKGGDPAEWPEDLRVREWPA